MITQSSDFPHYYRRLGIPPESQSSHTHNLFLFIFWSTDTNLLFKLFEGGSVGEVRLRLEVLAVNILSVSITVLPMFPFVIASMLLS